VSSASPRAGEDILVEVDWRRPAKLESGLGFLLHLEPSKGAPLIGDHVLLSSVLDLDTAPAGRTLRDIVPFHVPDDSKGRHWKIWVGVWRMRGTGERLRIEGRARERSPRTASSSESSTCDDLAPVWSHEQSRPGRTADPPLAFARRSPCYVRTS